MIEVRIHGRGGQGAVTASELLAIAAFHSGKYSQAFPRFGPERSGAPVEAFCRIDDEFIRLRTEVYEPDCLIVLDESLLNGINGVNGQRITDGLKRNGVAVLNCEQQHTVDGFKTFCVDATKIALEVFGKPIVSTAMLGAFAKATQLVKLESLEKAVAERFSGEVLEKNLSAMRKAYEAVK